MANTVFTQMDNKQLDTRILPKESFENEYARFIVDGTEMTGNYIVENALDELTKQGVNTSILTDGEVPSIAEVSYDTRVEGNYIYKVREDELKRAMNSKEALDEMNSRIQANLDQQDMKDRWRDFPKLLLKNRASFKAGQIVGSADDTDIAECLKAMREDIRKCKNPTDLYNSYSKVVSGVTKTLKTFTNRPVIFIRADFLDSIEIDYQSGIFNLDKIRIDADIIPVYDFYNAAGTNVDNNVLWLTCSPDFVRIYKTFEKRARLEDCRSFNISKAVTYLEYTSKLVPAIMHTKEVIQ